MTPEHNQEKSEASGRADSNRRRPAWEAGILPLNYARVTIRNPFMHKHIYQARLGVPVCPFVNRVKTKGYTLPCRNYHTQGI